MPTIGAVMIGSMAGESMFEKVFPTDPQVATNSGSLANYPVGPGDQLVIWALGAEELSDKPIRVDTTGFVDLPTVGKIRAGGLTVDELRSHIEARLKPYLRDPHVSISVTDFKSQPVSILGAVNRPGTYQLQGARTITEVLSMAEGPTADAGNIIYLRRAPNGTLGQVPDSTTDAGAKWSVTRLSLKSVLEGDADRMRLAPNDVVIVPRSAIVYVLGEVRKPGGFALGERDQVSVLQAIAMAEGLAKTAKPQKAQLLRKRADGGRTDISLDIRKMLQAKAPDAPMQPDDILLIPDNRAKSALGRAAEAAVTAATGVAIYRAAY